jgi:hypothetical protein
LQKLPETLLRQGVSCFVSHNLPDNLFSYKFAYGVAHTRLVAYFSPRLNIIFDLKWYYASYSGVEFPSVGGAGGSLK